MRYLITGGLGWIGSYVTNELSQYVPSNSIFILSHSTQAKTYPYMQGSLANYSFVKELIKWSKPDCIIYLAGRVKGYNLSEFVEGNVLWTANLLSACKELNWTGKLINTGSAAEYGLVAGGIADEDMECNPHTPYGISKWLQFNLFKSIQSSIQITHLRLFNPIGIGQKEAFVCGRIFEQIKSSIRLPILKINIYSDKPVRDFIAVEDIAKIIVKASQENWGFGPFNVGRGEHVSIKQLLLTIQKVIGKPIVIQLEKEEHVECEQKDIMVSNNNKILQNISKLSFESLESIIYRIVNSFT